MAKPADLNSNLLFLLSCVAVITILLLTSFNLVNYLAPKKVLGTEVNTENILKQKDFWVEFLNKNPTYYEGWAELSEINQKLGNEDQARENLNKAKEIKPNLVP